MQNAAVSSHHNVLDHSFASWPPAKIASHKLAHGPACLRVCNPRHSRTLPYAVGNPYSTACRLRRTSSAGDLHKTFSEPADSGTPSPSNSVTYNNSSSSSGGADGNGSDSASSVSGRASEGLFGCMPDRFARLSEARGDPGQRGRRRGAAEPSHSPSAVGNGACGGFADTTTVDPRHGVEIRAARHTIARHARGRQAPPQAAAHFAQHAASACSTASRPSGALETSSCTTLSQTAADPATEEPEGRPRVASACPPADMCGRSMAQSDSNARAGTCAARQGNESKSVKTAQSIRTLYPDLFVHGQPGVSTSTCIALAP